MFLKYRLLWNNIVRYFRERKYKYRKRDKKMKINIIYPESEAGWIIYKFAKNVNEELQKKGIESKISQTFDSSATINHYFSPNLIGYTSISKVDSSTTFMITHVDTKLKLDQILRLTQKGAIGICMSLETRDKLIASGVSRDKICYINPAQDALIQPRKINLGFTHRLYSDNRKKDDIILDICKKIDSKIFKFSIMGSGWDNIVKEMETMGFEVDYFPNFDKEKYDQLMPQLDYYCYFGFDEGSMGYLDAQAAGIGTIVTPQGYHLDMGCKITYPVETIDDIVAALLDIQTKREKSFNFANTWTWENYTDKHIEIWKYILRNEELPVLLQNRGKYVDGIFSLMLEDLNTYKSLREQIDSKKNK